MRPRKVILLVDSDPNSLSTMAYTLDVCGYRVVTATNAAEAFDIFAGAHVDLVLSQGWLPRGTTGFDMAKQMKALANFVPVVLLVAKPNLGEMGAADVLLPRDVCTEELLERIKVMSARKRGPRKGMHWETVDGKRRGVRPVTVETVIEVSA